MSSPSRHEIIEGAVNRDGELHLDAKQTRALISVVKSIEEYNGQLVKVMLKMLMEFNSLERTAIRAMIESALKGSE